MAKRRTRKPSPLSSPVRTRAGRRDMPQDVAVPDSARDPKTPAEVQVTMTPRAPIFDPTVGVAALGQRAAGLPTLPAAPAHRLVTVGDSLTHGFQSGAIFNT